MVGVVNIYICVKQHKTFEQQPYKKRELYSVRQK